MNTPANSNFSISGEYLGPVFSLRGDLTKKSQNIVFARNGTGKSFLSRAFRYLDLHGQGKELDNAPRNLVSDEAPDGKGAFSFGRGTNAMGSLQLDKAGGLSTAILNGTIFHVFSEDFVQEELREQEYNIDGKIENQIAVDSANIQLKEAEEARSRAESTSREAFDRLEGIFEKEKVAQLVEKAGVGRKLKEYGALSFEALLKKYVRKPEPPRKSCADFLKDIDSLKAIPAEPAYPEQVEIIALKEIDTSALSESLIKVTSPSSVSETIKAKIEKHTDFFKTGIEIVDHEHSTSCPFCEQGITAPDPKTVIDAYIEYFSDEEAEHKSELRSLYRSLNEKEKEITETETKLLRQKARYDTLKINLPSKKETLLTEAEDAIKLAADTLSLLKSAIHRKAKNLDNPESLPPNDLATQINAINEIILHNNQNVESLSKAVLKSDEERRELRRETCGTLEQEFAISRWPDIEALGALQKDAIDKTTALTTLKKSSPTSEARVRVGDTFELLLAEFFGDKYVFDKESFTLKRGYHEMVRGSHRTLSDGEKTAIAFCYFVACVHRKVKANSDYRRLFLVFDDPVTSMSYDYVFSIAQTLKNLSISDQGEVYINPGLIDGNKHRRPELLILTHSSYFFNISVSNKVVDDSAAFALNCEEGKHRIAPLDRYVAPFQEQLKDIYEIANGRDPDHSTANSIRSVLEAIGRFCRPDKSSSLSLFVQHLAAEDEIIVKSVLINSFSHGTYFDEMPTPDDLRLACNETIKVVKRYAFGQLAVIERIALRN